MSTLRDMESLNMDRAADRMSCVQYHQAFSTISGA
jgi:hypothetical protein